MNKNLRTVLFYLMIVAILGLVFVNMMGDPQGVSELTTSEFLAALDDGQVESVKVLARDGEIEGTFRESSGDDPKNFTTTFMGEDYLNEVMAESPDVEYEVDPQTGITFAAIFWNIVPILLLIGFMFFFLNQMQGGNSKIMSFGKSKAKRMTRDQPRITFKDVAGADEAIEELEEIREFLANPGKFQALGAKIPKGVLLVGPPGTGKTLLARAVAGEAAVPFFTISGSDFVEMFVGVGASRVRDLFEQAKAAAPCIIFMDEIDAVGRQRGAGLGGGRPFTAAVY